MVNTAKATKAAPATVVAPSSIIAAPTTKRVVNAAAIYAAAVSRTAKVAAANAHKYGANYKSCPAAKYTFKLTPAGLALANAAQGGATATCDNLTCYAAKLAGATLTHGVNGYEIMQAMLHASQLANQWQNTRASKYCGAGMPVRQAWASGYINGHAGKKALFSKTRV